MSGPYWTPEDARGQVEAWEAWRDDPRSGPHGQEGAFRAGYFAAVQRERQPKKTFRELHENEWVPPLGLEARESIVAAMGVRVNEQRDLIERLRVTALEADVKGIKDGFARRLGDDEARIQALETWQEAVRNAWPLSEGNPRR